MSPLYEGSLDVTGSAAPLVTSVEVHAEVESSSLVTVRVVPDIDHLLRRNLSAFRTDLEASLVTEDQSRFSTASA